LAPENLAIFTGTTLKPSFNNSTQPQKHKKEKGEGKEESGGETRLVIRTVFILPKSLRTSSDASIEEHRFQESRS